MSHLQKEKLCISPFPYEISPGLLCENLKHDRAIALELIVQPLQIRKVIGFNFKTFLRLSHLLEEDITLACYCFLCLMCVL